MRRLAGATELLDGPLDDPAALAGNLRDLARLNRWLGGSRASRRAIWRLLAGEASRSGRAAAGDPPLTLLDVGTGGADIPLDLLAAARRRDLPLEVTAADAREEVLRAARAVHPGLPAAAPALDLVVADGRRLPWPDRSFDVVHASLLVHHLEPPDAVALLSEARRVARRGVVVNDLVRARRHWLGALLLLPLLSRSRLTRHDGPLSVRRAYTRPELRELLAAAGLQPVAEFGALAGHRVAIAAVPAPDGRRGR